MLGFDCAGPHCAAALVAGRRVLADRHEDMASGQAERLLPLLEGLLSEAGLRWRDLAGLGVGVGPGNFTGLRISVAAARGLALALRRPAIGVPMAEARRLDLPATVAVVEPAPRSQILLLAPGPAALLPPEALPARIGAAPLTGAAAATAAARTGGPVLAPAVPLAVAIARIAAGRIAAGQPAPRPAPLYLRPPEAAPATAAPTLLPG